MSFPVSEEAIEAAERALGRSLPKPFRDRLVANNGGEITVGEDCWTVHPVWDATDQRKMGRTASHIVQETMAAREWHGFPKDAVTLASDGCGNHLITDDNGSVVFWDHETGEVAAIAIDWGG